MRSPKKKIASILSDLHKGLYEKEELLRLCLLASVAGENIFLLGPPGTAKSLVCRRLKYAFENARSFEYLLNQFSAPDEVFGPLSIRRLKDEGVYERLTEGFLPEAEIVFLDEIWKAGSAILNSLLTAINEKTFKNGSRSQTIPLKLLAAASNELPPEGGFEALWDRFLIRVKTGCISGARAFRAMLNADETSLSEKVFVRHPIRAAEFERWQRRIGKARLGAYAFNFIARLKRNIKKYNKSKNDIHQKIYISDRRWRKMARLVKASALLNGRKTGDLADCFLLEKCLWDRQEQIRETEELLRATMRNEGIVGVKARRVLRYEAASLKKEAVRALERLEDTRKTVLRRKTGFYSFTDPQSGMACFIKESDYEAACAEEKTITLYTQTPLETGYLSRNRHLLFKNGFDTFNSCGLDLEYRWKTGRSVCFTKSAPQKGQKTGVQNSGAHHYDEYIPDIYPITIDGTPAVLDTVTEGRVCRVSRAAEERERVLWDRKTAALFEAAGVQEKKLDVYIKKYIKPLYTNIFVDDEKVNIILEHITRARKELKKAALEILEAQNYYQNSKNERTALL